MKITWIGHSCFKLEKDGYTIITDPYAPGSVPGLSPVNETADQVYCSHEHGDHGYRAGVRIEKAAPVVSAYPASPKITEIATWHDPEKGALRGNNTIRIFDFGREKAAHLGDLGCELEEEQLDMLKSVDVLLIPVGGYYTIDALQSALLTRRLHPHIVIPMHYRDDKKGFGYPVIGTVTEYTDAMGGSFRAAGCMIDTADYASEEGKTQVVVMTPQNLQMRR